MSLDIELSARDYYLESFPKHSLIRTASLEPLNSLKPEMARLEISHHNEEDGTHGITGDDSSSSEDSSDFTSDHDETSSSGSSTTDDDAAEALLNQNAAEILNALVNAPNPIILMSDNEDSAEEHNTPPVANVSSSALEPTPPTDLKSRLASFIPQLQQANAALEMDTEAATKQLDDVDDGEERYIEMDLGLGVLTGKPVAEDEVVKTTVEEDSEASDDGELVSEDQGGAGIIQVGVVDKLKGVKPAKRKIEEVG